MSVVVRHKKETTKLIGLIGELSGKMSEKDIKIVLHYTVEMVDQKRTTKQQSCKNHLDHDDQDDQIVHVLIK